MDTLGVDTGSGTFGTLGDIMELRVVGIKLPDGTIEYLITNIGRDDMSAEDLAFIYRLRWGVESSSKTLKYGEELLWFHTRTREFILQEIFAGLAVCSVHTFLVRSLVHPPGALALPCALQPDRCCHNAPCLPVS